MELYVECSHCGLEMTITESRIDDLGNLAIKVDTHTCSCHTEAPSQELADSALTYDEAYDNGFQAGRQSALYDEEETESPNADQTP